MNYSAIGFWLIGWLLYIRAKFLKNQKSHTTIDRILIIILSPCLAESNHPTREFGMALTDTTKNFLMASTLLRQNWAIQRSRKRMYYVDNCSRKNFSTASLDSFQNQEYNKIVNRDGEGIPIIGGQNEYSKDGFINWCNGHTLMGGVYD